MSVAGKTRELDVALVTDAVRAMCIEANYDLPDDVCEALERGAEAEESPAGKAVFAQLAAHAAIARRDREPLCQATGFAVFIINLGQDTLLAFGLGFDVSATSDIFSYKKFECQWIGLANDCAHRSFDY